jgi:hypothetical protein
MQARYSQGGNRMLPEAGVVQNVGCTADKRKFNTRAFIAGWEEATIDADNFMVFCMERVV